LGILLQKLVEVDYIRSQSAQSERFLMD